MTAKQSFDEFAQEEISRLSRELTESLESCLGAKDNHVVVSYRIEPNVPQAKRILDMTIPEFFTKARFASVGAEGSYARILNLLCKAEMFDDDQWAEIKTVRDLVVGSRGSLLANKGFGLKSLRVVRKILAAERLALSGEKYRLYL